MDITQTEIDELRAAHARVTRPTRDYLPTDTPDKKLLRDSTLIPRLLAALEEAQAKLAKVVASFAAYINSEDEDRVAEWIDLCEAVKAGKVQP